MKKPLIIGLMLVAAVLAVPFWYFVGNSFSAKPEMQIYLTEPQKFAHTETVFIKEGSRSEFERVYRSEDGDVQDRKTFQMDDLEKAFSDIESRKGDTLLIIYSPQDSLVGSIMELQEKFESYGFGDVSITTYSVGKPTK